MLQTDCIENYREVKKETFRTDDQMIICDCKNAILQSGGIGIGCYGDKLGKVRGSCLAPESDCPGLNTDFNL